MGKIKTSIRRRRSSPNAPRTQEQCVLKLKKGASIRKIDAREELLNDELISRAIWECLKEGDAEGATEVISIYVEAFNKTAIARDASMARSTVYHALRSKNPTIRTLAKLVHACVLACSPKTGPA